MVIELHTAHVGTPIGTLEIMGNQSGVRSIRFVEKEPQEWLNHPSLQACATQLEEYFSGKRLHFESITATFTASDFQQAVWDALMQLPAGATTTYGELAEKVGHPGAARAVGTAMSSNPLLVLVPCHRVLPASGKVGEYACGTERKKWLLQHEGVEV